MRLLMNRALFYIYSVSGGAGKNFLLIANHLADSGWKVDVYCSTGKEHMLNRLNKSIELRLLKFKPCVKPLGAIMTVVCLIKALISTRYDCAFSTGYSNTALLILAALFSRFKGRLILRGALSLKAYKIIRPLKFFFVFNIYKLCRWCSDVCLINLNMDMHEEAVRYNFGGKNVTKFVVGNPVNVQEILRKSKERSNFNLISKNNKIKLFSVGRLVKEKNFFRVCEVVESLSTIYDCILILFGEGPLHWDLKQYINERGLEKRIILAGYQENPYTIISNCDIMLSTSTAEGMPNAILESIALGKPIVALDCETGPREILERYNAGLLVKKDTVSAYIEALHKLISKKKAVNKVMIEKLSNDLSIESIGFAYLNIFNGTIAY